MKTQTNTKLRSGQNRSAETTLANLLALTSPFELAPLPYAVDALEPVIDEETMKIHHDQHHQAYVTKANEALRDERVSLGEIFADASDRPAAVRNNAGGHWNHTFFWSVMGGQASEQTMPPRLQRELEKSFGSLDKFKAAFTQAGETQFGSGWAWLIRTEAGALKIVASPNQDNPLMDSFAERGWPILCVDVWEHAYYLKYQNRRSEFLKAFWSVVNWKAVDRFDLEALENDLP